MTDLSRSMFWRFPFALSLAHASEKLYTYAATLPLLLYERPVFSASGAGAVLRLNRTSRHNRRKPCIQLEGMRKRRRHICRKTKGKIIRVGVLYTPFPIIELQPMPFRRSPCNPSSRSNAYGYCCTTKKQTHSLKFLPSLRRTRRRETAKTSHGARDL